MSLVNSHLSLVKTISIQLKVLFVLDFLLMADS